MNIPDYRIEPADFHADNADLHAVRDTVFVHEQNIPAEIEWDDLDPGSIHVLARGDAEHQPIGAGRLTPAGKIGRIAVLRAWRGQGVGSALLSTLLHEAQKRGWLNVSLNAQTSALGFYRRFGFEAAGAIFTEVGIPHQTLSMRLEPLPAAVRRSAPALAPAVAASEFEHFDDALAATLTLIGAARRSLGIVTPNLELAFYGHPDVIAALKQFARQSRDGCARIIVQNPLALRGQTHPLLVLAQKLPSSFQFRTPVEADDLNYESVYLFNDRNGYLFRLAGDRYAGVWSPALPSRARQLAEEFERFWQRAQPCTEFTALNI